MTASPASDPVPAPLAAPAPLPPAAPARERAPDGDALPAGCLERVERLLGRGTRVLIGLSGPPAAGKSTVAAQLVAAFAGRGDPEFARLVPMDGFHLANEELARLGRGGRKGAPDTFDGDGYLRLLERLRAPRAGEVVYAPEFRREIETAVAGAIAVGPATRLVVTEGNYLLLDQAPWSAIPALLDETWYVGLDEALRVERLVARHVRHGRTPQAARDWVEASDQPNALLIAASRHRATLQIERPGGA